MKTPSLDTSPEPEHIRLGAVLDAMPCYALLVDDRHRIVFANRLLLEFSGKRLDELVGQHCPKAVHGADGAFPGCPLEQAVAESRAVEREIYDEKKRKWVLSAIYPVDCTTDDGHRIYLHTARDITQEKRTREWLIMTNQTFVQFGPDPIANIRRITELCGSVLGGACALYSCLQDGLLVVTGAWNAPSDLNPADKPEGHICFDVIQNSGSEAILVRNLHESHYAVTDPNVRRYGLHTYFGQAVKCQGVHMGSLCVVFKDDFEPDASERRFLGILAAAVGVEEERRRSMADLQKIQEQLWRSQKLEAIGRLAGGVAHDFNNLLTVISGTADFLAQDATLGSAPDIATIKAAAERAASLTRQLLAFSRKQVLQPKVLNLNDVVADAEKLLRRLIGEDMDFAVSLDPALGSVKVDPSQIEQVIVNLVVNARDACQPGGRITIQSKNVELTGNNGESPRLLGEPGPYVMVAVGDNGCGIDPETEEHLFEPYFTTKTDGKGTGLGLATVYGIVQQSGGHIRVESEPGHGTTMKVFLPRVAEEKKADITQVQKGLMVAGEGTVLVVEDEPALRAIARRALEIGGYKVLEAGDGRAALEICRSYRQPIHVILSDVVMPGMGGPQLAEKAIELHPEAKIVFMSGYTEDAVARQGMLLPGSAFMEKPFSPSGLLRKVKELLV